MYGWDLSNWWYGLAVLALIVAVVYAIFNAFQNDQSGGVRHQNNVNATSFFLAAVALGVLALAQHGYSKMGMMKHHGSC